MPANDLGLEFKKKNIGELVTQLPLNFYEVGQPVSLRCLKDIFLYDILFKFSRDFYLKYPACS